MWTPAGRVEEYRQKSFSMTVLQPTVPTVHPTNPQSNKLTLVSLFAVNYFNMYENMFISSVLFCFQGENISIVKCEASVCKEEMQK